MNDGDDLYRVLCLLADGRRVYHSKRGCVELCSRAICEQAIVAGQAAHSIGARDPAVYSQDLGLYGPRSLFLESLRPFVMVVGMTMEPADAPLDRDAVIMGGVRASEVGTWSRSTRRKPR